MAGALASPFTVVVLSEREDGAYGETLEALEAGLTGHGEDGAPVLVRISVPEGAPLPQDRLTPARSDLVVTLGARMARRALSASLPVPVLCALVPEGAYDTALDATKSTAPPQVSALYLDQPWSRQLRLIQLAFPDVRHVAVALGPSSREEEEALRKAADELSVDLHITQVNEDEAPIEVLRRVLLDPSDVLLAVPDPVVYNSRSVQGILMDTYRHGVPVVGFSKAYVAAGAVLGLYTTPAQVGSEAAALIREARGSAGLVLPEARHPKEFTVSINRQVARSLEIRIPEEDDLERRLRALEAAP